MKRRRRGEGEKEEQGGWEEEGISKSKKSSTLHPGERQSMAKTGPSSEKRGLQAIITARPLNRQRCVCTAFLVWPEIASPTGTTARIEPFTQAIRPGKSATGTTLTQNFRRLQRPKKENSTRTSFRQSEGKALCKSDLMPLTTMITELGRLWLVEAIRDLMTRLCAAAAAIVGRSNEVAEHVAWLLNRNLRLRRMHCGWVAAGGRSRRRD